MFDEDDDKEPFLLVLGVLAAVIAIVCWWFLAGRADDGTASVAAVPTTEAHGDDDGGAAELTPSAVAIAYAGQSVTLSGVVPDAATKEAMAAAAAEGFDGEVIDELTIDNSTTTEGGTVTITGSASSPDEAEGMVARFAGLATGAGYGVTDNILTEEPADVMPSEVTIDYSTDEVTLTGVVPSRDVADAMVATVSDNFDGEVIDELEVDDAITAIGTVTILGTIDPLAHSSFVTAVGEVAEGAGYAVDDQLEDAEEASLEIELDALFELEPIEFDSGSANIRATSRSTLESAAEIILANPGGTIEVQGHTDNEGDAGFNQQLSQQRADAVVNFLIGEGVDAGTISAVGYGQDQPIDTNDTPEGRQNNRRIKFEVTAQ